MGNKFQRGVKAPLPPGAVISSPLGDTVATPFASADVGKAVKFQAGAVGLAIGTLEAVLCTDSDPIEGFVNSINPDTVNDGYSFGGVLIKGQAIVARGATAVSIALGDFVVMDGAQAALGTTEALVNVKSVTVDATTVAGTPLWQVTQILTGDGTTAGDQLLIERIGA